VRVWAPARIWNPVDRESVPDSLKLLSRLAGRQLRTALRNQPAAALLGPRQVGKTTLARALGGTYFDLELETERLRLDLEWEQLAALAEAIGAERRILVSRSSEIIESDAGLVCNLPWLLEDMKRLLRA
jgi:hypothetical protein